MEVTDALLDERFPLPQHGDGESKRERGTVLIVNAMPGAAELAGLAALRVGAGRLRICTDPAAVPALAVAVPEARVAPIDDLAALRDGADAVLLAADVDLPPGDGVVIADAGGLGRGGDVVLPNESEAPDAPDAAVVAVRGASTRITAGGEVYVVAGGGNALATSGSGDVLAGMVAGLAARGADPLTATLWAVHLHARAGRRLAIGALAREIIDEAAAPLRRR